MNRKGFTLVELLFVVVLMAVIAMITLPNIFMMLQSSKDEKYEEYEKLLVESLKLYNIDHGEDLWADGDGLKTVTYEQLQTVNRNIKIDGCTVARLEIAKNANNYNYYVCMSCEVDNTLKNFGSC